MSHDIFGFLARVADDNVRLRCLESFARALKAAIKKHDFEIDGMRFVHAGSADESDLTNKGRHTMFYHLLGSEKLYRVIVEPVAETHRQRPPNCRAPNRSYCPDGCCEPHPSYGGQ